MEERSGRRNMACTIHPLNINYPKDSSSASIMCDTARTVNYHASIDSDSNAFKPDLYTVEGRLETFKNWANDKISPKKLAEAGFYFTSHADVVRCPFCQIEGFKWLSEDNPMADHRRWSIAQRRNCRFLAGQSGDDDQQQQQSASGRDTCGKYGVEILPNSVPEDSVNLEKLGVTKVKGPQHPEYRLVNARLDSYKQWPKSLKQKPEDLASAGFFYIGVGDQTLCFHCGGGLKDWEENDEPWEQHAMWFPKCNYLLMKKGVEYVNSLKQTEEAPANAEEASTSSEPSAKSDKPAEDSDKDHTLCKICFKNELGVVFLPCGHIVACVDCASALTNCAVCRKPLEATVRAFLS